MPLSRSENMRRIRARDTKPEMYIRRLIHRLGFRYRLHVKTLPGCPDLVFRRMSAVVFVHGCFWHQHEECRSNRVPLSNRTYWEKKLAQNTARDAASLEALRRLGWRVLVVWECDIKEPDQLVGKLRDFLEENASSPNEKHSKGSTRGSTAPRALIKKEN